MRERLPRNDVLSRGCAGTRGVFAAPDATVILAWDISTPIAIGASSMHVCGRTKHSKRDICSHLFRFATVQHDNAGETKAWKDKILIAAAPCPDLGDVR